VHQSFGRYVQVLKPGFHLINPISENVIEVDMKTSVFNMAPQQIITKDNVSMQIQTVVYYRAINPYKLVYKLRNDTQQIREFIKEISYSALRSVMGENVFQELLENRAKVASQLEEFVKEKVYPWGLYIENIFIKGTAFCM
jgi:erythrocyte band 7 integral membrane protein